VSEPIVMELFVSALLGRFVNVLAEPLIDLFVSVCELSVSTSVLLAGIVVPFSVVVELLVSVVNEPVFGVVAPMVPFKAPLSLDREVNAPEADTPEPIEVLFIVELEIVTLTIEPPVIATLFAFCAAIVPSPVMAVLGIVVLAVMALVPLPYT